MASLGEETRASCRGPANHNAVALILPHKAMLGFDGGAIGADIYCDRSGILCRTLADCARVLDALKDPVEGFYDPRDPYTTVPRSSVLTTRYADHAEASGAPGALKGTRIGIVRESMLNPGTKAAEPITTAAAREIKAVLGERLGATLVESSDPLWKPDPGIEDMKTDFRRALARLVPVFMPDLLFRLTAEGQPVFPDFAAAIVPTEFAPGKIFGAGALQPIDYLVELADGRIAPPANLDISTVQQQELAMSFRYHIRQYLSRRATDWKARGCTETLVDWPALNARSKYWGDDQRAAFKNWEEVTDPRNPLGGRQGVDERIMLRELPAARGHDGDDREPPRCAGAAAHAGAAGENRRRKRAGTPGAAPRRVTVRPERGPDGDPGPGGLRHHRLRSGFRAEPGPEALRAGRHRYACRHTGARAAVLAGIPRRARQGGRRPEDSLGLRSRLEATSAAAGFRAAASRSPDTGRTRADSVVRAPQALVLGDLVVAPPRHQCLEVPLELPVLQILGDGDAHIRRRVVDASGRRDVIADPERFL
jgi:hypothetical protein